MHLQTFILSSDYVEQNYHACFGYDTLYPQSCLSLPKIEGKLKILGINQKCEEIIYIYLIFFTFGDFYCDIVKRKCLCLVGLY